MPKVDYIEIKILRNSDSIAELNGVSLKISLFEEDERVYTIKFIPPWFQEKDLRQELKLAFNQSARIFNVRRQTRNFEKEGVVTHLSEPHYWFSVAGVETVPTAIQFGRKLCYIFLKDQCRKCKEIGHMANSEACKAGSDKTNVLNPQIMRESQIC